MGISEIAAAEGLSPEYTAKLIDEEVQSIVKKMEGTALEVLRTNRNKLDALAKELMEHETLDNSEVSALFDRVADQTGNDGLAKSA